MGKPKRENSRPVLVSSRVHSPLRWPGGSPTVLAIEMHVDKLIPCGIYWGKHWSNRESMGQLIELAKLTGAQLQGDFGQSFLCGLEDQQCNEVGFFLVLMDWLVQVARIPGCICLLLPAEAFDLSLPFSPLVLTTSGLGNWDQERQEEGQVEQEEQRPRIPDLESLEVLVLAAALQRGEMQ
ncbi:hypothetical protein DUI87_27787 [Hirundo rustica rustica]|uniref:Uncharacterized protein n=1 Tax=Hirundo rustica rustica TaxID=333673 RepID=A0A3M0J4D7_HIRRU|nr:hypothetical protein DUI87_27787 [Hirundo rustica rustica]